MTLYYTVIGYLLLNFQSRGYFFSKFFFFCVYNPYISVHSRKLYTQRLISY